MQLPGATLIPMRSVDLKLLFDRLNECLGLAASGETIQVTDRDRVIAEIGPPREAGTPFLVDGMLAETVRKGWLTLPVSSAGQVPPTSKPVAPLRDLLAELEDDRGER